MSERPIIRRGDKTTHGGTVITASGNTFDADLGWALVGDLVACPQHGVTPIITGASFFTVDGRPVALDGDRTACGSLLIASQTHTVVDDGVPTVAMGGVAFAATADAHEPTASKLTSDAQVAPGVTICPNMTDAEFRALALRLRDEAVELIERQRLPELLRWDAPAQARVREWFGVADLQLRDYLIAGLRACARVLRELTGSNFVRYADHYWESVGCSKTREDARAAAVCKKDTRNHVIGIELPFCALPDNMVIYGTNIIRDGDSKLLTLVHEVTHFDDTFGSFDTWNTTRHSRDNANQPGSHKNADSLSAYILGVSRNE